MLDNGWKIIRFSEQIVKTDWEQIDKALNEVINCDTLTSPLKVGIVKAPLSSYKKVPKLENGKSIKQQEASFKQRKVKERPSLEELENLLLTNSYVAVGKMYNVSDSCIRKWIK